MKMLQPVFRGLLAILVMAPVSVWAQGSRMSSDFLPLGVGNSWVYAVSSEDGNKVGDVSFSVRELTIISGRSFYVLSGFPFVRDENIRLVRYDRDDRQFVKATGSTGGFESPLFFDDATIVVLQEDSTGLVQRFNLNSGATTLTFERGVGVIAARYETPNGVRLAKITSSRVGEGPRPSEISAAPPAPPARPGNVAAATEENPALVLDATPTAAGLKLTLNVLNTSDKLLPFRFSSGQSYDFVITDPATGQEVWRWSRGMFFTQVVRSDSIRANGAWKFEVVWDRRDRNSNPVSPGQYRLTGVVASIPPIESRPMLLELQ